MKRLTAFMLGILIFANIGFVTAKTEEMNMWKFDFGAEGTKTKEGYVKITPDMHVINSENRAYGFIGTNEKDYRLHGGRIDGFIQLKGQVIDLCANERGIGSLGLKDKTVKNFNSGDYYPVRFSMKVKDDSYYKVKVTVTTFDETKGATASLYTERKHPIFTKKVLSPGEEVYYEFTVRVTPVYYEKSDPKGLIEDEYLSVCLLGENAALSEMVIEEIPTAPTLWILGDSTVTDGGGALPFFPLQNYTGVGTAVTKYLPETIAMVNEGEGGLSAHDNSHFNVVKDRLKEGDFLWVEYGHNHKSDGVPGYESVIGKYYEACKKVGATLILVGPIDRINNFDEQTNTWHSSLKGFSDAAKKFVDQKNTEYDKIAFVDLNEPSLKWFGEITKEGVVNGQKYTNEKKLVYYYFQSHKGATDVDHTHPNDTGAENLAYLFFENADCEAYPALKPLLTRFNTGKSEKPVRVEENILQGGFPANNAWAYFDNTVKYEYPLEITDVEINNHNEILSVKCKLLDKNQLSSYAAAFVQINDKTYQTTIESHIDNSAANNGSVYTLYFNKEDLPKANEGSYRVYMAAVDMADGDKPIENIKNFSKDYIPGEYSAYVLATSDSDEENFDYYGYHRLTGSGDWSFGGNLKNDSLKSENGKTFVHLSGESFSLSRALSQTDGGIAPKGRYEFSVDIKKGMGGKISFALSNSWRNSLPYIQGDYITLFEVLDNKVMLNDKMLCETGDNFTKVTCILDMDEGFLKVSANGNESTKVLANYQTFNQPQVQNLNRFVINCEGKVDVQLSNLFGAKCNQYEKTKATINVTTLGNEYGKALIDMEDITGKEVNSGQWVTLTALPNENGRFAGWFCGDYEYSQKEAIDVRLYKGMDITAKFLKQTPKTSVDINVIDTKGNVLKKVKVTEDANGKELHEKMKFVTNESYKEPVIIKKGDCMDIYYFKYSQNEAIDSLLPEGENNVTLVFGRDGSYVLYETFDNINNTWGFDKEAKAGDGVLHLLTGVGTANRASSVKELDEKVKTLKNLTVFFEWKNDVDTAKGRNSSFDLMDSEGNVIFSICGKGKNGISYIAGESGEKVISNNYVGVNDWYKVKISADFEKGAVFGSIVNKATGREIEIEPFLTKAACLSKVSATYGYSSASQQLSLFAVRDNCQSSTVKNVENHGDKIVVTVKAKTDGEHAYVAALYNGNELERILTKTVALKEGEEAEVVFSVAHTGEVKIFEME